MLLSGADVGPSIGCRTRPHCSLNAIGDVLRVLVFPCTDDGPPLSAQSNIRDRVPGEISLQLRPPVVLVNRRTSVVLRAAMPEAAVDEHGNLGTRKDDVGCHADA